jgi:hypothetical protein
MVFLAGSIHWRGSSKISMLLWLFPRWSRSSHSIDRISSKHLICYILLVLEYVRSLLPMCVLTKVQHGAWLPYVCAC